MYCGNALIEQMLEQEFWSDAIWVAAFDKKFLHACGIATEEEEQCSS